MVTSYPYPLNISYLCTFKPQTSLDVLGSAEWLAHFPKESCLVVILLFWWVFPRKKNILEKCISYTKLIKKTPSQNAFWFSCTRRVDITLAGTFHPSLSFAIQWCNLREGRNTFIGGKKNQFIFGLEIFLPLWKKCFLSCNFRTCFL